MSEEIRPLREEEMDALATMVAQGFRAPAAQARRARGLWKPAETRGVFVDGVLKAGMRVLDVPMWIGAGTVAHWGVTAVASPPENRRRGYIGRMLHALLAEQRERGVPLASLYAFRFPFYRRYGWEHVSDVTTYKLPIEQLPAGDGGGMWEPVQRTTDFTPDPAVPLSDAALGDLRSLYDAWCVGRVGPFARDAFWWRYRTLREDGEHRPDVYLWRDGAGVPGAYVLYAFEEQPDTWRKRMVVRELVARDGAALRAALGFVRNHDSQATRAELQLPPDVPLLALLDDPEIKVEVEAGALLRLVDVAAALAARPYAPGAAGTLTLAVHDDFCAWNTGPFTLTVADGRGMVERTGATPGLRLDVRALSRLYLGYLSATTLGRLGLLEAADPAALGVADGLFAGPTPWFADFF